MASRPSSSGMRMSISTTSGRSARTWSTASRPSRRLADDLDVAARRRGSCGSRRGPAPGRRRAGRGSRARLHRQRRRAARSRRRRAGRPRASPPKSATRSRMPDEPVAVARRRSCVPRPSSLISSCTESRRYTGSTHFGVRALRVLEGVRQPLLDDPVRGQVDAGRQLAAARPRRAASTGRPASPTCAIRRSRCCRPGCGASAAGCSSPVAHARRTYVASRSAPAGRSARPRAAPPARAPAPP